MISAIPISLKDLDDGWWSLPWF